MVKDAVCGMEVNEETAQNKSIHMGNVYHFCSTTCKTEFDKNPEKYAGKETTLRHHTSHYGGYCGTPGCGAPARGFAWYLYIGLLLLLTLLLLLAR